MSGFSRITVSANICARRSVSRLKFKGRYQVLKVITRSSLAPAKNEKKNIVSKRPRHKKIHKKIQRRAKNSTHIRNIYAPPREVAKLSALLLAVNARRIL